MANAGERDHRPKDFSLSPRVRSWTGYKSLLARVPVSAREAPDASIPLP